MKSTTCIINGVSRFLNLGKHHITFLSPETQVLKYNTLIFGCRSINDYGYFLSFQNLTRVGKA